MKIVLNKKAELRWLKHTCHVVIGTGGFCPASQKKEGDGATPIGVFFLRRVLFRADRLIQPETNLPVRPILPDDGWCDEPTDIAYNRPVVLPYPASSEALFRQDHVYDLLLVLGHNDLPPKSGIGSAIFMHLARKNRSPTRGCIALPEPDLRKILREADIGSQLHIG